MIEFNPVSHIYRNSATGEKYKSVTTLISSYSKPFDKQGNAERVAKKQGVSVDSVLDDWAMIAKKACDYGTMVHKVMENWLKGNSIEDEDFDNYIAPITRIWEPNKKLITSEKITWLHTYKLAGTADVFEDHGKYFNLYDFKTNKKFNFINAFGDFMLNPVSHLSDCEYSKYSMQLSMYAYMLSNITGQRVGELAMFHYDRDVKGWRKYYTPYLKKEIECILNYDKFVL